MSFGCCSFADNSVENTAYYNQGGPDRSDEKYFFTLHSLFILLVYTVETAFNILRRKLLFLQGDLSRSAAMGNIIRKTDEKSKCESKIEN